MTLIALCAAGLGLTAGALAGRHVCHTIATGFLVETAAPAAPADPATTVASSSSGCAHSPAESESGCPPPAEDAITDEPFRKATLDRTAGKGRRGRAARPMPAPPEPDAFLGQLARGITRVGEHRYAIEPDALALALRNLPLLGRAARVMPDLRDGKPVGYRLIWVRADGPFADLGLRSDDVLVSVNGLDIATPDQVLDAYGKLKNVRVVALELLRDGQRSTLEYVIR